MQRWKKQPSRGVGVGGGTGSYVTRSHVRLSRRGVEACHMVGVKNKDDSFYVVAAPGYFNGGFGVCWRGFIPEIDRGSITCRRRSSFVGDKQMD